MQPLSIHSKQFWLPEIMAKISQKMGLDTHHFNIADRKNASTIKHHTFEACFSEGPCKA